MFITVGDAKIYATSFGRATAPAFLGVGGWIGNWELWTEPFSCLSENWRTIGYDHRGAGLTIAPVESIKFDTLVDDVFAVMDAYGIEQCVLGAESMGAMIALGSALKNPQRITGLVIVDGLYYNPTPPESNKFLAGLKNAYLQTIDRFIDSCLPEKDSDHIKRWGQLIFNRATQESAIALSALTHSVDLRGDLSHITQPTLILHGALDAIVPLSAAQWLAKTIPNSRLTVINDAGHVPTITRSHEVAQAIQDFFKM